MIVLACFWWFLSAYLVYCAIENNLLFVKPPTVDIKRKKWPLISILVPARNEAQRIEPCLKSLLALDYLRYEILVLDDRSTDSTFNLVRQYVERNRAKRLKIIKGQELPEGWLGKPWACYQLSLKAQGEWLFFIDADTWHLPETLKRTVQMAEKEKAEVLSLLTRQVTRTWMEALVIPVMAFHLLAFFPTRLALKSKSRWNRFAGVSGQFIFIRKTVYRMFGGHQMVKDEVVEDLNLGKKLVQKVIELFWVMGAIFHFAVCIQTQKKFGKVFLKIFSPLRDIR